MNRRELLVGTASALVAGTAGPAFAQFKPTRPIEFVVHGGPGSGNDVFARTLTTIIDQEKLLPVRMQVVNKPGGGSTSAAAYVVSKKNDPHVIACFTNIWLLDPLVQEAATNKLLDMSPIARLVVELGGHVQFAVQRHDEEVTDPSRRSREACIPSTHDVASWLAVTAEIMKRDSRSDKSTPGLRDAL